MPVTSPSYFPPSRGTDQIVGITAGQSQTGARVFLAGQSAGAHSTISDFIAIGNVAAGNAITDSNLSGTTVIGSKSLATVTSGVGFNASGPVVSIGYNNAPLANTLASSQLIGDNIAPNFSGGTGGGALDIDACVMIGSQVYYYPDSTPSHASSPTLSVLIGYQAFRAAGAHRTPTGMAQCVSNVIIGAQACLNVGNAQSTGTGITSAVVIGAAAGSQMGNGSGYLPTLDVIIGAGAMSDYTNGSQNTFIGGGNSTVNVSGTVSNNVAIGYGITQVGNLNNTLIGANIIGPYAANQCIFIGASAGRTQAGGTSHVFILETNISPNQYALFYGRLDLGNLVIGNSLDSGSTRDIGGAGGTNCLKLLNGTKFTAGALSGGGYFYVSSGALHWVGSGGTDTTLAGA